MAHSMDRWVGTVAVVTGASSGIGAAIAKQLVQEGVKVVGLARRKALLDKLGKQLEGSSGKFYGVKTDLTKQEEILSAVKWAAENVGPVHILVNNAGAARSTSLSDGSTEIWKKTLDLNVLGLCIATREVLRIMKTNKIAGHIININSVAGHQVPHIPNMNVYAASKFAVTALSDTLRFELNSIGSKTKVTSVSPGRVHTGMAEASGVDPAVIEQFKAMPALQAEDVADAVMYALSTPPHVQVRELTIKPVNEAF